MSEKKELERLILKVMELPRDYRGKVVVDIDFRDGDIVAFHQINGAKVCNLGRLKK